MLTRLKVKGFKNLVDVDLHFGPLTCLAGPNGAGKSNVFDAIQFLSELADRPFVEAAKAIRGGDEPQSLCTGGKPGAVELLAEMVIPRFGFDDFGQPAEASATFLEYELHLVVVPADAPQVGHRIQLIKEELSYIPKGLAKERLGSSFSELWRNTAVIPTYRRTTFISTEHAGSPEAVVRLQSDRSQTEGKDKRGGGRAYGFVAGRLPRTVLSSAQNAEETRTAVLLRQEMRRWRQLQLEPSALRRADDFQSEDRLAVSGAHVPATLYRLALDNSSDPGKIYATTANRLAALVDGVRSVRIERDETHKTLRFMMEDLHGLELPASSLSDGTMRFVALSIIEQDARETGVICLEEPENGIHPQRMEAMLSLLYDIAVDAGEEVSDTNPLRQIIVTTHSPLVARAVLAADLVFARTMLRGQANERIPSLELAALPGTWRQEFPTSTVQKGIVLEYLTGDSVPQVSPRVPPRVVDQYRQALLPFDLVE